MQNVLNCTEIICSGCLKISKLFIQCSFDMQFWFPVVQVIYQTRGRVFCQISKHLEVGWNNEAQPSFNQLQSVSISDETLFGVFDIASQSIDNSWRNSKQKFTEFYDIKTFFTVVISFVLSSWFIHEFEKGWIKIDYFIESAPYGFLFTSRKTLETKEWVSKVLQRVNKIHTKHLLWCNLFVIYIRPISCNKPSK